MDTGKATQILELMGVTNIKFNGQNLICSCPFARWTHPKGIDKNPSFGILVSEESKWNCFACGVKGTSERTLIAKYAQLSGRDLSYLVGGKTERKETEFVSVFPFGPPKDWSKTTSNVQVLHVNEEKELNFNDYTKFLKQRNPYMASRGLTEEQIVKWQIGWDGYNDRIFIPIFDREKKFIGYTFRQTKRVPKYLHSKGFSKDKYFFGEDHFIPEKRFCFLTEGNFDCFALDRAGVPNVFAVLGGGVGDKRLLKLYDWVDLIVVAFDADEQGVRMSEDWREQLLDLGKHVIIAPKIKGKKDLGEYTLYETKVMIQKIVTDHQLESNIFGQS